MESDPLILKGELLIEERKHVLHSLAPPEQKGVRLLQLGLFFFPVTHFLYALVNSCFFLHDRFYLVSGSLCAVLSLDVFVGIFCGGGCGGGLASGARRSFWRQAGILSAGALVAGAGLGVLLYSSLLIFFFAYRDLRVFTNVLASDQPARFADAGMLSFAHSSAVDVSRAVGFKSFADGGTMYCLAPIVDSSMLPADEVRFWAVGKDCCGSRSSFHCGDVHLPTAHTGVVILQPEMFVPPAGMWMVRDQRALLENYVRGVRLASSVFDIPLSADTGSDVFVSWSQRPFRVQEKYKERADWYISFATFFGVAVLGIHAATWTGKRARGLDNQILV